MGKEATTITREISKLGRAQSSAISVNSIKPKSEKPILQTQEKTKIKSLSVNKNLINAQIKYTMVEETHMICFDY